jgi:hypothetical protein
VFLRRYSAADGFKSFCQASQVRRLLYYTLGRPKIAKSPYNFAIKWLVEQYLKALYNDPTFSAPWVDMTSDWRAYQPRKNSDPEKATGFQLMYDQLNDYRPLQNWIKGRDISIIHLIRRNALKLLLSRVKSKSTKQYHFAGGNGSTKKVSLDRASVISQLSKIVSKQTEVKQKFPDNPYLEISYERFFSDYLEESGKVLTFLGVERDDMEFPQFLKKLNPDSLGDLIENYDEIALTLQGTLYQEFLD